MEQGLHLPQQHHRVPVQGHCSLLPPRRELHPGQKSTNLLVYRRIQQHDFQQHRSSNHSQVELINCVLSYNYYQLYWSNTSRAIVITLCLFVCLSIHPSECVSAKAAILNILSVLHRWILKWYRYGVFIIDFSLTWKTDLYSIYVYVYCILLLLAPTLIIIFWSYTFNLNRN